MAKNNTIIIILIVILVVLAGFTYNLYSEALKCKATATELGNKLIQCKAGLDQAVTGATQCQEILTGLQQVPACAPYIPTE